MKHTSKTYLDNWNNIFSEEVKNRQKLTEQELLKKEQVYHEELAIQQLLEKKKQKKFILKIKSKPQGK